MEMLFEQSPVGMVVIGRDHRIRRANDAFCRLLGYTEAELKTLTFDDITHPDDLMLDVGLAERMFEDAIHSYEIQKRYQRKDGTTVKVHMTAWLARNGRDQIVGGAAVVHALPLGAKREAARVQYTMGQPARALSERDVERIRNAILG